MVADSLEAGDSEPGPVLNNYKHPGGLGIKAFRIHPLKEQVHGHRGYEVEKREMSNR